MSWAEHIRRGEFAAAWQLSDAALISRAGVPCWHLPRHLQYIWDGTPLDDKRVLVRCYHGLGDTIQFIRYASMVKALGATVTVWAPDALLPLLCKMRGVDHLLPLHDGTPEVEYDVDVEVMELPHLFRTTPATIPAAVPYLHVDPAPLPTERRLAVGLVWQAGEWDKHRSIPFPLLATLAEIPGVTLYILQHDARLAGWHEGCGTLIGNRTLAEFARIVGALDLLISVDSMPAHLAGALAVPVWTLLHAAADWRWMEERATSPWYPTMRLFRQERSGEWGPVIARAAAELEQLSATTTLPTEC